MIDLVIVVLYLLVTLAGRKVKKWGQTLSLFFHACVVAPMFLYILNLKIDIKTYLISVALGSGVIVVFRESVPEDYVIISQIVGAAVTFVSMFALGKCSKSLGHSWSQNLEISRA